MAHTYNDYLSTAASYKAKLDQAEIERDTKNIIYYSGKYLYYLKQAYRIDPTGLVPPSVIGLPTSRPIDAEIQLQLTNHQNRINFAIRQNKAEANINRPTFSTELKLKIRRLKTRISQLRHVRGSTRGKDVAKDALSVAGTALKAPVMITSKVASKFGPLAITIVTLPVTVLASLLSITFDISENKSTNKNYSDTAVHQMTDALKDGVRRISNKVYETTGRI